ncbi:ChaN family lipoprotein [Roseobacter sp. GAI101]|uniref:ChaN family lipoprotein n=1 Tax=Roseobacter sp. (strain GAI101) TaxID=391589 RepID=UPI000187212D|nr:ChaN family lipoprotein [Roseobacter sp. GAI101]EEB83057.1 conserved hypothetical protein [Roseobacter sp. GAI101]
MKALFLAFAFLASAAFAAELGSDDFAQLSAAKIVILGETHDNPVHHLLQADIVSRLRPKAVVYEMLTPEQAGSVTSGLVGNQVALEGALGWNAAGWPDFAMYYPIFKASGDATVFGAAVPRQVARSAMKDGLATAFGAQAGQFGLNTPLGPDEQSAREALQMAAHCDALPEDLLPAMVDIQRLRDARLAQSALQALQETGGPVVVITGNGHARKDWGVPAALAHVQPETAVFAVGQGEDGQAPEGGFDLVLDAPSVRRADPCDGFRTN